MICTWAAWWSARWRCCAGAENAAEGGVGVDEIIAPFIARATELHDPAGRALRPRDLSPLTAARAALALDAKGATPRAARSGKAAPEVPSGAARLDALLAEAQRNPALSRAPDPALHHHPDGSYSFRGNGLDAHIDPDGRVHFRDKYMQGMTSI